jgi:hypothetical protein
MSKRFSFVHVGVAALLAAGVTTAIGVAQQVGAGPSVASTFTPITPCRLADTRPAPDLVGTRSTPLSAGETAVFAVWGTNGNCTIPTTATGVAMNATAVGPTSAGFVTIFPADASRPLTSNLNFVAGSPPTPNQVTVGLSDAGAIRAYNLSGSVALIIDIVGYYSAATSGPAGPAGPAGVTGPAGARGVSAWDTIPSGQTVTGNFGVLDSYAVGSYYQSIPLPARATAALTTAQINFSADGTAATTDDDATCTGTAAAPTAPAGKLCMYLYLQSGSSGLNGFQAQNLGDQAFYIVWNVSAAGAAQMAFTWAYTAP